MAHEPPMDPPDPIEDVWGISDYNIRERAEAIVSEEYPPFENIYEFYESFLRPRDRKAFCVTCLLEFIPDDPEHTCVGEKSARGRMLALFRTWRDWKFGKSAKQYMSVRHGKAANQYMPDDKSEMYPVCYGIVERFFEDVIEPTEKEADDYTDETNWNNPFTLFLNVIATNFNDSSAYYEEYMDYFIKNYVNEEKILDELIAEKKEDRALASVDYPPPDEEY